MLIKNIIPQVNMTISIHIKILMAFCMGLSQERYYMGSLLLAASE